MSETEKKGREGNASDHPPDVRTAADAAPAESLSGENGAAAASAEHPSGESDGAAASEENRFGERYVSAAPEEPDVLAGGYRSAAASEVGIPRKDLLWYLGCRGQDPGPEVNRKIDKVCRELEEHAAPALFYLRFPLTADSDGYPVIAGVPVRSGNLRKNLTGCESVLLCAATLGTETDRLLYRYAQTDLSGQTILQAASAALLEAFLDQEQDRIRREAAGQGLYLRPRFSPGYGDFPLESQLWIFDLLKPGRRLGITLTSSLLMIPSKSVTAVAGLGRKDIGCRKNGCEACTLTSCAFRR